MLHFAEERQVSHRTAALCLGVHEVAEVKKKRGLFPWWGPNQARGWRL